MNFSDLEVTTPSSSSALASGSTIAATNIGVDGATTATNADTFYPRFLVEIISRLRNDFRDLHGDYYILQAQFLRIPEHINSTLFAAKGVEDPLVFFKVEQDIQNLLEKIVDWERSGCSSSEVTKLTKFRDELGKHNVLLSQYYHFRDLLTELRIQLEGPNWHIYEHNVVYQAIGNQPNSGQRVSSPPKRSKLPAPKKTTPANRATVVKKDSVSKPARKSLPPGVQVFPLASPSASTGVSGTSVLSDSFLSTPHITSNEELASKDKEIADLKSSLASEVTRRIRATETFHVTLRDQEADVSDLKRQANYLIVQLGEKDKEIEFLKRQLRMPSVAAEEQASFSAEQCLKRKFEDNGSEKLEDRELKGQKTELADDFSQGD